MPLSLLGSARRQQQIIAVTCVTYLRWYFGANDKTTLEFLRNRKLREYTVLEWPDHSEKSEEQIMGREQEKEVLVSFCKEAAFQEWLVARARLDSRFSVHFALERKSIYPKPLHIAVFSTCGALDASSCRMLTQVMPQVVLLCTSPPDRALRNRTWPAFGRRRDRHV